MNLEIKKQWLEALRSGRYKQGQQALCRESDFGKYTYCCLGVLCDLAQTAGIVTRLELTSAQIDELAVDDWEGEAIFDYFSSNGESNFGTLPEVVRQWTGLVSSNPEVNSPFGLTSLSQLNDLHSLSFFEIADLIERDL